MIYSPHILKVLNQDPQFDSEMNPVENNPQWNTIGNCRCDDNGTMKQVSVNGQLFDFSYHIVYKGDEIKENSEICVYDGEEIRGKGKVIKKSRSNYFNYRELWIQ